MQNLIIGSFLTGKTTLLNSLTSSLQSQSIYSLSKIVAIDKNQVFDNLNSIIDKFDKGAFPNSKLFFVEGSLLEILAYSAVLKDLKKITIENFNMIYNKVEKYFRHNKFKYILFCQNDSKVEGGVAVNLIRQQIQDYIFRFIYLFTGKFSFHEGYLSLNGSLNTRLEYMNSLNLLK